MTTYRLISVFPMNVSHKICMRIGTISATVASNVCQRNVLRLTVTTGYYMNWNGLNWIWETSPKKISTTNFPGD